MRSNAAAPLKLGMTASLTGRYQGPGRQARAGVQAWVDDTNRAGGVWVRDQSAMLPVQLICYDDNGQGEQCATLTERLILEDQVDILLGPYASGLTRRAAAIAERYEHVLWNHGGSTDAIYRAGHHWVVSLLTPASRYFYGVIDAILDTCQTVPRVVILHGTTGAFPRDVASGAAQHCQRLGLDQVELHPYSADTDDFTPFVRPLLADPPDLLLSVGRIEDDLQVASQMVQLGLRPQAIGLIVAPLQRFHTAMGADANGFMGPSQWEPGVVRAPDYGPSTAEVLKSFERHAPDDIDYPMAQAYAACLVIQKCIEEAGSLSPVGLRQVAGELAFSTFYGRYQIEPLSGRQVGHVMPVIQWQAAQKVIVWPPELRQQPLLLCD